MNDFYLGTAPFCDPNPKGCEETPGYVYDGKSKSGDGASCWSGTKIRCKYDPEKWKQSSQYQSLLRQDPGLGDSDIKPSYVWYGKAPFCSADECDAYQSGKIPINRSSCGDGSCCWFGEKVLAREPITEEEKERLETGMRECFTLSQEQERTLQAGLKLGSEVAGAAGTLMGMP